MNFGRLCKVMMCSQELVASLEVAKTRLVVAKAQGFVSLQNLSCMGLVSIPNSQSSAVRAFTWGCHGIADAQALPMVTSRLCPRGRTC